ncbi:MAG: tryptophan-rich sensory protein [Lachnospiraceae bacterium]|nr:tryptophan-rich sensory protein [Lachnospiraceae bacterium]
MQIEWNKIEWKKLIVCVAIPLAVGALSAYFSGGMNNFDSLVKPPLSPPGWVFPVVWTILYTLMGIASYLVLVSEESSMVKSNALAVYGVQLIFNFFWSIIFFRYQCYGCAFVWLLLLEVFVVLTALLFGQIDKRAGWLMVPYIVWVAFAGYLNAGIALLN